MLNSAQETNSLHEYGIVVSAFTPSIHSSRSVVGLFLKWKSVNVLKMVPPRTLKWCMCGILMVLTRTLHFPYYIHAGGFLCIFCTHVQQPICKSQRITMSCILVVKIAFSQKRIQGEYKCLKSHLKSHTTATGYMYIYNLNAF